MSPPNSATIAEKLLKMIEAEEGDKGQLLILYQISQLLDASAQTVGDLHEEVIVCREELKLHKKEIDLKFTTYDEVVNKGKGMWAASGKLLIIAQAIFTVVAAFGSVHYFETVNMATDAKNSTNYLKGQITQINRQLRERK